MPRSRKLKHNWLFLNGRIGEYDRTPMIIIIILSSLSIMDHFSIKEVIIGNLFARQFKTVFNESIDFESCCIAYKTCKIRMIMLEGTSFPNVQFVLLKRPHSPPSLECSGNNDGSAVFPVWWSHSSGKSDSLLKNFN